MFINIIIAYVNISTPIENITSLHLSKYSVIRMTWWPDNWKSTIECMLF